MNIDENFEVGFCKTAGVTSETLSKILAKRVKKVKTVDPVASYVLEKRNIPQAYLNSRTSSGREKIKGRGVSRNLAGDKLKNKLKDSSKVNKDMLKKEIDSENKTRFNDKILGDRFASPKKEADDLAKFDRSALRESHKKFIGTVQEMYPNRKKGK